MTCSLSFSKSEQVPPFHFLVDVNMDTGVSADSYETLLASIKKVGAKSLNFHLERGDFEKWVSDILKDAKLAREIDELKRQDLRGQVLRQRLYIKVSERIEDRGKSRSRFLRSFEKIWRTGPKVR